MYKDTTVTYRDISQRVYPHWGRFPTFQRSDTYERRVCLNVF